MSTAQKVIKYLSLAFAIFLIVNIITGILFGIRGLAIIFGLTGNKTEYTENLEEIYIGSQDKQISNLKIELKYSTLNIKTGETLKVETNNKDIVCKESNNQLVIKEKKHNWFYNDDRSELVIYIPENIVFNMVDIETGAGEINIDSLKTEKLEFEIGAGKVEISKLTVLNNAKIDGGAGKVRIASGEIKNLDLDLGAGKFEITSKLTGRNNIEAGVGKLDISLVDSTENYTIKVDKGIGSITIDGKEAQDAGTYGNGNSYIKVEGGVGAIDIK